MENVFIPLVIIVIVIFALIKLMNTMLSFGKSFFYKTEETVKDMTNEKKPCKNILMQIAKATDKYEKKGSSVGGALKLEVIFLAVFILLSALFPKVFGWIWLIPLLIFTNH